MTDEREFRQMVHRAVEAYAASAREDACQVQRILNMAERKVNPPMKKKLTLATILVAVLVLMSLTAVAVGVVISLSVHETWMQSFAKMNTTGVVYSLSDESEAEIPLEEAVAIAQNAICEKYGTEAATLDGMGLYPSYIKRGYDGVDTEPSCWEIYFSSRTGVNIQEASSDYGPEGEYRVYINAETREVTFCNWYTNDFWSRAQIIWDCGTHDEVYAEYSKPDFYTLPQAEQAYWTETLAAAGYQTVATDNKLYTLLLSAKIDRKFCPLDELLPSTDPQVAAAWEALEAHSGLDAETLQKYAWVATNPGWETGTDNICLHYSYEKEWKMMETGHLDRWSDRIFWYATHFGLYMVSFEPGTTNVTAITHVPISAEGSEAKAADGLLFTRTDWTAAELEAFDGIYTALDRAVKRMRAAKVDEVNAWNIVSAYITQYGALASFHGEPPEDWAQWFAETSEWDAYITEPEMTFEEFLLAYGEDRRFWPLEILASLEPEDYRLPNPGETTLEEATALGLSAIADVHGQAALDELARLSPTGQYTVNCIRISLTNDPDKVDCRWEVYVTADPFNPVEGFQVCWGEWETHVSDEPYVQDINDIGNG